MPKGGPMALSLLAAALAAGCASGRSGQAQPPAWFVDRAAELDRQGYPRLANVPDRVDANLNPTYWDGVRRELDADRTALQANPRSQPPPAADAHAAAATAFDAEARADIEATRLKH